MKSNNQRLPRPPFIIENSTPSEWVDAQVVLQAFPAFSIRDLQNMRDQKIIPYAKPIGKILYHLPSLLKALEADAYRHSVTKKRES